MRILPRACCATPAKAWNLRASGLPSGPTLLAATAVTSMSGIACSCSWYWSTPRLWRAALSWRVTPAATSAALGLPENRDTVSACVAAPATRALRAVCMVMWARLISPFLTAICGISSANPTGSLAGTRYRLAMAADSLGSPGGISSIGVPPMSGIALNRSVAVLMSSRSTAWPAYRWA